MSDERKKVNREYKDRLFKLVFREKADLLQLYNTINGTNYDKPEDMEINTLEDAALDCHAVVLNINCGHNKSIMKRCRRLEEYSLFIGRVREYTGQKMVIKEAIDLAVEDCIREGILATVLKENREEVCSMLLTEYDEQSHIESEKEIAREEGREEGIQEGIHMVALLAECLERDGRLQDLKLLSDAKVRGRLFREYHIIKD